MMDGINLCSRFSYQPCHLGYCGPEKADAEIIDFLVNGKGSPKEKLLKFEGLMPYLELIGSKNNLDAFDYKVVEAYWLGNDLLDKVSTDEIRAMMRRVFPKYLTDSVAEILASKVPDGVKAHHSFHVFHVLNVSSLTGKVPANLNTLNNCFPNPAQVLSVNGDTLKVNALKIVDHEMTEVEMEAKLAPWLKIKKDDFVVLHWGLACHKHDEKSHSELKKLIIKQSGLLL